MESIMYQQDQRNRRTRRQGSHAPGEFDQHTAPHQPQQWNDQGYMQAGGQWDEDEFSRAPGASYASGPYAPGSNTAGEQGDHGGPTTQAYRSQYRPTEAELARTSSTRHAVPSRVNAYGPSEVGFNQGYAQAADGSGWNPGFTPGDYTSLYGAGNSYGAPEYTGGYRPGNAGYGAMRHSRSERSSDYGHDRGFFDRASDEVASWFGNEDAARRREEDHRGRGPEGYVRSDERIREDACDRLTDDWAVDARNITLSVSNGEITLDGTVDSRAAKRRAEECVENISGVGHVQNNLRIQNRIAAADGSATRSQSET